MRTLLVTASFLATCFAAPAFAASCDGFSDVDASNTTYCSAVTYLKDRGITVGCGSGSTYCPNDPVTRLQMALFLQRMGKGGASDTLGDSTDTIGGGDDNVTGTENGGAYETIGGGIGNTAMSNASVVAGGTANSATGSNSVVGGGSGNAASGYVSAIPGGIDNTASGSDSFAAGAHAIADQTKCVVFSLWDTATGLSCLGTSNIFRIGADHGFSVDYNSERDDGGGFRWVAIGDLFSNQTISTWNGAYLSDAGVWTSVSDRAAKTDFTAIDPANVLDKVAALPIAQWRYKVETNQRHIGPVAQDFYSAFRLGDDDKHIATIDEGGVALAAIQGLNAKLESNNAKLENENAALRENLESVNARLDALSNAMLGGGR